MDPKNLKEAQRIVDSLDWYKKAKAFVVGQSAATINIEDGYGRGQQISLPGAAKLAAFNVWRQDCDLKEAELRRRAEQIGLRL